MRPAKPQLLSFLKPYKKYIVIGALVCLSAFTLLALGLGFAAYQTYSYAKEEFKNRQSLPAETLAQLPKELSTDELEQLPKEARGFVETFVLSLSSGWLEQNLSSREGTQFKVGLACFDALGGPSPETVISYARSRLEDPSLLAKLDGLSDSLRKDGSEGPAACAQWILNG